MVAPRARRRGGRVLGPALGALESVARLGSLATLLDRVSFAAEHAYDSFQTEVRELRVREEVVGAVPLTVGERLEKALDERRLPQGSTLA